ncbi:hypothetical protein EW146_g9586 [Bondarzewia mesenterica]|uniref:Uncharacterized protein n=1 Tax=Bondarzewia mesenterica TaxID=1095465 RepID=A0A4S4L596_9AGAM|nr:hypothetical protein EW146_g9586 [Bondarzewia mesenterica]
MSHLASTSRAPSPYSDDYGLQRPARSSFSPSPTLTTDYPPRHNPSVPSTLDLLPHQPHRAPDDATPPSDNAPRHVSTLARRIHGWSWQAFPIGMGTGAVYVTLSGLKNHSSALTTVETVFYFLNMILFVLNSTTLLIQALVYPRQAWRLVQDPVKGIFVPLIVLSFATIIIGTINYAVPSGQIEPGFIYALFWVYVTFAVLVCFPMLMIWFNKPHDLTTFTPAWAFLVFPLMLVGVVAFNVLRVMDPSNPRTLGVLFVGYFFQGLGFFVTIFYICIYMIRSVPPPSSHAMPLFGSTGFLDGHQANGAFVACGPPGFTALALINLGARAREM